MSVKQSIVGLCLAICGVHVATRMLDDGCHINHCEHGGTCYPQEVWPSFWCQCAHGYTGKHCEHEPCIARHCEHNGTCIQQPVSPYFSCNCRTGYSGNRCEHNLTTTEDSTTTSSTTSRPTTITTTAATTTKTSPLYYNHCPKLATVTDIAMMSVSTNGNASICPTSGEHTSPGAFVLNHCNVTLPNTWKPGRKMMASCKNIPVYTPIAIFEHGVYAETSCGVFLGCIANGFKIGLQHCDHTPTIEHVEVGGANVRDPYMYFSIQ